MSDAGFGVETEGYLNNWNPDGESQNKAVNFGKGIAKL